MTAKQTQPEQDLQGQIDDLKRDLRKVSQAYLAMVPTLEARKIALKAVKQEVADARS